ncbi:MAG: RNA-directed DNA polymerase, partial [Anaerovoracaceae bacterium]
MCFFFFLIELPSITEHQKLALNGPILREEVLTAIRSLQTGKAPGQDGLSSEFYAEFLDILVYPLLEMFNYSLENGTLPTSLREANISLLLKKGKQPEDCASYRPISLLNSDFKILSKILATRLEGLLPQLIKEDQTGFIKGRSCGNSIRRLLNIIQFSHEQKMDSLVSMDAEKAFDRVEWPYLFYTLSNFG